MSIEKRWMAALLGMAGALLLSACVTDADTASESGPEREYEVLSEVEFETVMGQDEPAVAETIASSGLPRPAGFYTVFFDLGAETLSDAGMRVVNEIADEWGADVAKLRLVGHADASGPKSYNQRLSERRAKAVRDALVDLGIGPGRLIDGGAGETDLLVPTADGVSEGHNRRVTITVE